MNLIECQVFIVERRLLMGYYPGALGGLSDVAFRAYLLMCRGNRPYRDSDQGRLQPNFVWNSLNEMRRAGGLSIRDVNLYNAAIEELRNKQYVVHRPQRQTRRRTLVHEVLVLPDYADGLYRQYFQPTRNAENLTALGRGYIQVPRPLGDHNGFFHRNSAETWAVILKLYQYNHLVATGGIELDALRRENEEMVVHPSLYEELSMSRVEFLEQVELIRNQGLLEFVPVEYQRIDLGGYEQMRFVRDSEASDTYVLRLAYQPADHVREWNTGLGLRHFRRRRR